MFMYEGFFVAKFPSAGTAAARRVVTDVKGGKKYS